MRSSRSSWRACRPRARSRRRHGDTAFRARCCCAGDGRFGLSRRMPPNLVSYRRWWSRNRDRRLVQSRRRVDRDRVCGRGSDADHGPGRHGDAEDRRRCAGRWTASVIPISSGVRVWIATGHTDMRRGMNSLALLVQEAFTRDPHGGDLYVFRGRSGKLIKILWHDGLGMSLYAKRLERGRFLWPSSADGVVAITPAQLGYLLEGIDWRMPQHTWRPRAAG